MRFLFVAHVFLCLAGVVQPFCPSQCTCVYHGRSDGTGTRSVLCNDPDMSNIPVNVPVDTVKLRVEKTAVRRIPTEAFYYLTDLRYLWVTYNAITSVDAGSFYNLKALHELRLDGNMIATFPWESLREMPSLRTLDLHNNRITSLPTEAVPYLVNITYLDISSNKLTSLPSDLMDIWPPFSGVPLSANSSQKVILGLQDNPWFCDCKISKLIELSKMADTPVIMMDYFLSCNGPENLSGVLFQRAELDQCLKPSVMTSATKITSPLGSNVLLRCDATGHPTPNLFWTRSDGTQVNNTVVQESPSEGIRWSILSLNGILYKDAGEYRCKAKNVAGNAEASITLSVDGVDPTTAAPNNVAKRPEGDTGEGSPIPLTRVSSVSTPIASTFTTRAPLTTTTTFPTQKDLGPGEGIQRSPPDSKMQQGAADNNAVDDKSRKKASKPSLKDLQVVEEMTDSAVLIWKAEGLASGAPLSVVLFPAEEEDAKVTLKTEAGKGKLLLDDLKPNQVYKVCLATKAIALGKEQCTEFATLNSANTDRQTKVLVIASAIACVLAVPLIVLLIYKILSLYCRRPSSSGDANDEELSKETYVKFETLTMKQRTMNGQGNDLWARRQTHESERMLLCSRSSIDSQLTYKSDSSRSEYLC
ncbi:leucine-rich repeat, immunoglobulin-like domain and transmembrane domain-containing protein 3a [Denticeps clupeoides]|uniref:Ig-like domain-containing protein n=1 Tax=Denticeps clupeoides TaxID=299321 RepID=A0AAY4CHF3_9TELE|nr:leucine-rich repeat, immunoglobulin-like domain and transmembrane domain-containing protein 3 [Denticeps clupeoides]